LAQSNGGTIADAVMRKVFMKKSRDHEEEEETKAEIESPEKKSPIKTEEMIRKVIQEEVKKL